MKRYISYKMPKISYDFIYQGEHLQVFINSMVNINNYLQWINLDTSKKVSLD